MQSLTIRACVSAAVVVVCLLDLRCAPIHDLDQLSSGAGVAHGGASSAGSAAAGASSSIAGGGSNNGGSAGSAAVGGGGTAGSAVLPGASGDGGRAGCPETAGYANAPLGDVPEFAQDCPITGDVQLSAESSWEVAAGVMEPAYQVRTPTAVYFLHLASGALVSLTDPSAGTQWIQYSFGGQPDRGIPMLGGCCNPPANGNPALVPMVTTKDDSKSSTTHLHVDSTSVDSKWRLSWDFYLTHLTITVEQAGADYGFSYKGTPGGSMNDLAEDLWLNGYGQQDAAVYASSQDLPYPESVRFASRASMGSSLFLVQHRDDCFPDRYRARSLPSEKTAVFTFGDGMIPALRRTRVSLGLVPNDQAVARVAYVVQLMK